MGAITEAMLLQDQITFDVGYRLPPRMSLKGGARPRMISRRFGGAVGARKSGIVLAVRRGRRKNSTGHSVILGSFSWTYVPGSGSLMYSDWRISASGFSAPLVWP